MKHKSFSIKWNWISWVSLAFVLIVSALAGLGGYLIGTSIYSKRIIYVEPTIAYQNFLIEYENQDNLNSIQLIQNFVNSKNEEWLLWFDMRNGDWDIKNEAIEIFEKINVTQREDGHFVLNFMPIWTGKFSIDENYAKGFYYGLKPTMISWKNFDTTTLITNDIIKNNFSYESTQEEIKLTLEINFLDNFLDLINQNNEIQELFINDLFLEKENNSFEGWINFGARMKEHYDFAKFESTNGISQKIVPFNISFT